MQYGLVPNTGLGGGVNPAGGKQGIVLTLEMDIIMAFTMAPHCNGKIFKSQSFFKFFEQNVFFYKAECISMTLLYIKSKVQVRFKKVRASMQAVTVR